VAPSSTIFLLDVRTGSFRRLRSVATNPWSSAEPKWSPDGAKIAFVASTRPYAVDAVFVQAVGSGEPVELHTRPAGSVMGFTWDGDSKSIFMQLANGAKRPIVRLSLTAGHSETVSDTGVHSLQFSASKRGDLAWIESTGSTYGVIRYLLAGTKASTVLANLNPQMLTWDLGEQQIVRWSNKGGDALEGILVRPVGYRAGHRYPLIVDPYGNRVNDFQGIPILANQTLAAKGYALFFPNHRGPQTFAPQNLGKAACAKACWTSDPGVLEVEDILSGVDALIHQGVADPDRLYLYGVSNGASAVNLILTRTGRFRAAVSFGGVADWFNYYMYRTPDDWTIPDFLAGKTPERDLALYLSISPLYHVPGVTTPLLLLTGDNDSRAIQAVLFYDGLRRLGKPVTLVRYSGEGHGISDANLKDYWNRVEEFLSQDRKP
jgi:dipeptidyl aminopeptidase/acylaminoacyl peptidase